MPDTKTELLAALIFLVLILGALYQTMQIDLAFSSELETLTGPRAYPGLILGAMLLLDLGIIVKSIVRLRAGRVQSAAENTLPEKNRAGLLKVAALFAALVVFVMVFEPVGYLLAMTVLLLIAALLHGAPRLHRALLITILMLLICLLIFRYGLNTVLPEGVLSIDMIL